VYSNLEIVDITSNYLNKQRKEKTKRKKIKRTDKYITLETELEEIKMNSQKWNMRIKKKIKKK
jgi:hypothetical protein